VLRISPSVSRTRAALLLLAAASVLAGCYGNFAGVARTRAANDFGCEESQIEITSLGGTSYGAEGCGSHQVNDCALSDVRGTGSAVCVPENAPSTGGQAASRPASPTDVPKRTDAAAPAGAAGFAFGSTIDATRAACEEKFAWTSSAADVFECSGTPRTIGPAARTLLKFCGEGLCRAIFLVRPGSDASSDWLHEFVALKGTLVGKYGPPVEDKTVPSSCVDDIVPCVRDGSAHVKDSWTFHDGTYIVLVLSNPPGSDTLIRMTYGRPDPAQAPAL
jgi:hypothetical protein